MGEEIALDHREDPRRRADTLQTLPEVGSTGGKAMNTTTKDDQLHCQRCNHRWWPQHKDRLPIACPRCHSFKWQEPKDKDAVR